MLRKSRRGRPITFPGLLERLEEIVSAARAPEEALEPALQTVLDAVGARAGAICLFDPRQGCLRLATEIGLSNEGCKRLRLVRSGDPTAWDMPLHGLVNRRAYLIESAARNRYVPRLTEQFTTVRTVACVPLYSGPIPVGTLILIAVSPRSFGERDIEALETPGQSLARLIEQVRRHAAGAPADGEDIPRTPVADFHALRIEHERLLAELEARQQEQTRLAARHEHLTGELSTRIAEREHMSSELGARGGEIDRLRATLAAAGAERDRLASELERTSREANRAELLAEQLAAAVEERTGSSAELDGLRAANAELERRLTGAARGRREAEEAIATLRVELKRAERLADETAARAQTFDSERRELAGRLTSSEIGLTHERDLSAARQQELQRLSTELHAAIEREQHLRNELQAAAERLGVGQDGVREGLEAARAAEEARSVAEATATVLREELEGARAQIEALESEASHAHEERTQAEATAQGATSEVEQMKEVVEATRGELAQAEARIAATQRELSALRDAHEQALATGSVYSVQTSALEARSVAVTAEAERLRDEITSVRAESDNLSAAMAAAVSARTRLEEALASETEERIRLAEAVAAAQAACAVMEAGRERSLEMLAAREAEAARLLAERDAAVAELNGQRDVTISKPAPVEVVKLARPTRVQRLSEPDADRAAVVVVDMVAAWERVEAGERRIVVVAPSAEARDEIAELAPKRILVNLAVPGALAMLPALGELAGDRRLWGCLVAPGASTGLPLGTIQAAEPLDPEALIPALGDYATRGRRIVTVGADVDALMSLRQALSRQGMSVSMAWDGKQAVDLLEVVRPEVVIVDLALPRRDGYGVLVALSKVTPIPHAVVVGVGDEDAEGFAGLLDDQRMASRLLPMERLLSDALRRTDAAPANEAQRAKVRALARGK